MTREYKLPSGVATAVDLAPGLDGSVTDGNDALVRMSRRGALPAANVG